MNIKQGQKLRECINKYIESGDYQEANKQSKKLLQEANRNNWPEFIVFALSIQIAYAIENNELDVADKLVKALEQQPPTSYGMFLRARLLLKQKKKREALEMGKKALAFSNIHKDSCTKEIFEKIYNLLGILYSEYGAHKDALNCYWQAMEASVPLDLKAINYSNYLFNLHFGYNNPADYYNAHLGYNDMFKDVAWYTHDNKYQLEAIVGKATGKIRVGYISPDLRYHVVLRFCWVMLANYDKEHFEVYCYHNDPLEDDYSCDIRSMTDRWRNISGMNAQEAAEVIYNDRVDILVDLAGHTKGNALPILAYKPAPIQISGIGYFATTGLKAIDYFLSDKALESESQYFVEELINLEHSHFCYSPLYKAPAPGEAPCIKNGYITFGSFNAIRKVTDEVLELWTTIIKSVPESHLLLKGSAFDDEYGYELFCQRLIKFGIDMKEEEWKKRIELRGFSHDYLKDYLDMDIALDTFPYPGGGTTCDALYMGVPTITLSGNNHGERFGKSLLENIGLSEFVVYSKQAYYDLAVALADAKDIINNLHIGLRHKMEISPLMDSVLYMKELEEAYGEIWQRYISKLHPVECPSAKVALNNSFDCYKGKDYGRAEAWCRLALEQDKESKYQLEGKSLLSDILQEKLEYLEAWQESKSVLEMLQQEHNKGTKDFQQRLWLNFASRSHKLGFIGEAVRGFKRAAELVDNVYGKFGLTASALLVDLCRIENATEVKQRLKEINNIFSHKEIIKKSEPDKHSQRKNNHKIHLAYISPDFRQHVMFSFYYTMLHSYNRENFYVTCVNIADKQDGYTEHLKGLVDKWIDVSEMTWPEIIAQLKKENIDILVDLAGHSADSGLPVFYDRVARVQISGLGWMESTGISCVDYLITDKYIDPDTSNITEHPLYLTSQFCYTGRNDVPVCQGTPCKEKGYITFGVFNHYCKWTDEMLLAWKEIMDRVPTSQLLLKCQVLVSESTRSMVSERLEELGFDLSRIVLEPATNTYMNRYLDVDIALDTYPYPGGGTTCDALYMGVPVVSLYGNRRGSRFGLSILNNTGLGELAVDNVHDYVERAVGLANDTELLDALHKSLRKMMTAAPIMDGKKYMEELESAYISILAGK